ncbi:MAG: hypothetical protein ACTS80_01630 [Candidatus Hodgkinia cicadicola]
MVLNFQININEGGGFANFVEWAAYFQVRSCMLQSLNVLVRNGNLIWSEGKWWTGWSNVRAFQLKPAWMKGRKGN